MKKQLLLLVMILLPLVASGHDIAVENDDGVRINYNIIGAGKELEVTNNDGNTGDVVIPETVIYNENTYSVTSIGVCAFQNCSGLTSITIPNSVTSIGDCAFQKCSGLTSITIPNSVTSIGRSAFSSCSGLTSITIPNSVTSIGRFAFSSCSGLTSISVESGNSNYDSRENCNAIIETATNTLILGCQNTVIPNSVTTISGFGGCTSLTSITIPNSVTTIGKHAFSGCTGLTSITIPNSVTSIGEQAFQECTGLTSVTIGDGVTTLEGYVFNACTALTSVTIGNSVTTIGQGAFIGCDGLSEFFCYAKDVPATDSYAFYYVNLNGVKLYVPAESIKTYSSVEPWKSFNPIVPLPQLIYKVDEEVYKSITPMIGDVIVPEAAPTKEGYTFSGWSEIPETMPAKDVIVEGTFSINSYTITYMIDNAVFDTQTVEYAAAITPPTAPTRDGYTFEWLELPATMPASDITIIGSYTSGIGFVRSDEQGVKWYTLEGKPIDTPRKGINIKRSADGMTKKVVIK